MTAIETTVTDPTTGDVITFTGTSDADVEAQIDAFFGNDIAEEAAQESPGKSCADFLSKARADLAKLQTKLSAAHDTYASTIDGAADTYRQYQLCGDTAEKQSLYERYLRGAELSDKEYQSRVSLKHSAYDDGPVCALALDYSDVALSDFLIAEQVIGAYRPSNAMRSGKHTIVTLVRFEGDKRRRMTLGYPATDGLPPRSLEDVIRFAQESGTYRSRLGAFLGDTAQDLPALP